MATHFACDMSAIPTGERAAHHRLIQRLMTEAVEDIRELRDGLVFQFPAEEYDAVTEFVARERLCCPFLTFTLEVQPERRPLLLRLTGAEGVRDFIRAELQLPAGPGLDW
jgi:hypothetical protein